MNQRWVGLALVAAGLVVLRAGRLTKRPLRHEISGGRFDDGWTADTWLDEEGPEGEVCSSEVERAPRVVVRGAMGVVRVVGAERDSIAISS